MVHHRNLYKNSKVPELFGSFLGEDSITNSRTLFAQWQFMKILILLQLLIFFCGSSAFKAIKLFYAYLRIKAREK